MKNITNISGLKIKVAVKKTGKTREKVVSLVQDILIDKGATFSLAGLDKLIRGELPEKNSEDVLDALAFVCGCHAKDFEESEAMTA